MTRNRSPWLKRLEEIGAQQDLEPGELKDLNEATARVYRLMADERWHTATEIISASGQREGLRRMRTLRRLFEVEKRRGRGREFEYRISGVKPRRVRFVTATFFDL